MAGRRRTAGRRTAMARCVHMGIVLLIAGTIVALNLSGYSKQQEHRIDSSRSDLTAGRRLLQKGNDDQQENNIAQETTEDYPTWVKADVSEIEKELMGMVESQNGTSNDSEECSLPAYEEFPHDGLTAQQRAHGAIILHILVTIYMFLGLAIICDDYFVSSLEKICSRLNIGEDVAGATFMAAGSSAPELFTSIIGVFIAKGDVGVGTIVGSAVFNILAIIGLCGIAAGMVVELTWWPLFRDTSYYSLAIVILIVVIFNGEVTWYESVIMLVMYAIYIVIMKFNSKIVWKMAQRKVEKEHEEHGDHVDTHSIGLPEHVRTIYEEENGERNSIEISVPMVQMDKVVRRRSGTEREEAIQRYLNQRRSSATSLEYQRQHRLEYPEAVTKLMLGKQFSAKTRLQMATRVIIQEQQKKRDDNLNKQRSSTINQSQMSMNSSIGAIMKSNRALKHEITKSYLSLSGAFSPSYINIAHGAPETEEDEQEEFDDWKKGPPTADGCVAVFKWVLFLPLQCLFYVSVPDCRKQRWERWFFVTFTMSIVWIAVFSYVMVWMVAIIGYTIHIPDSIMGITFLAAGTSIPDGMASLIVAKQGLGDMAVSNSIGSNVFDILLGLALPWFVKTAIVSSGETVHINSNGLVYSVILLFGTVVVTIGSIHFNKWKLDRKLGFGLLVVYVVFLVFSCLIEFNVFGYVNAPPCARTGY